VTSSRRRHPENCSDIVPLADLLRSAPWSLKPFHKICNLDLVFDANLGNGHLYHSEPFFDALVP